MALGGTAFAADSISDDEFTNAPIEDEISTETPETPTEEVVEVEVAEPEVTTDKARDPETGKFVKKEGEADEPAPVEVTPETPAVPVEPGPPVAEVADPFVFAVSGKQYTLEGAVIKPDGLYVPLAQVDNTRKAIAEGVYYKQNWQQIERTNQDKGYQRALAESPEIRQAKAMMAQLQPLLSDPDVAAEFLSDFHTNAPILRANAEAAMLREQLEQLNNGQRQQQESGQREQMEQARGSMLAETMNELRAVPDTKILTKEDWAVIDQQIGRLNQRNALFVEREGDTYLDVPAIEEIAEYVVRVRKEAIATAKKAEEALKFNAGNTPKPGTVKKPGSAAVAPRTGGAPKAAAPKEDSRDVVSAFMSGKLDDDE